MQLWERPAMSKFILDRATRNEMMKEVIKAIEEVESDLIINIKQKSGMIRDVELSQLDVLSKISERVIANLQ
jgi:hypothetical protein